MTLGIQTPAPEAYRLQGDHKVPFFMTEKVLETFKNTLKIYIFCLLGCEFN